jgi:hypothetical protein
MAGEGLSAVTVTKLPTQMAAACAPMQRCRQLYRVRPGAHLADCVCMYMCMAWHGIAPGHDAVVDSSIVP